MSLFALKLSFSRYPAFIWSTREDQLAWHRVHNEAFRRFDGIPAVVRIDNLKTGMARGAGPGGGSACRRLLRLSGKGLCQASYAILDSFRYHVREAKRNTLVVKVLLEQ